MMFLIQMIISSRYINWYFRRKRKASTLLSSTSLITTAVVTAAQHRRCYLSSSSSTSSTVPSYSVLIFSAADILFRLTEAFVGQVEEVQKNCFRKVSKKKRKLKLNKKNFFLPFCDRLWTHAIQIKKTHQSTKVIDRAVSHQHLPANTSHLTHLLLIVIKNQKPVVFVGVAVVPVRGTYWHTTSPTLISLALSYCAKEFLCFCAFFA